MNLYWLTFLQKLPSISQVPSHSQPSHQDNSPLLTQTVETSDPTVAQVDLGGGLFLFPGLIVGLVVLLIIGIFAFKKVYVITPTNEAFVLTGGVMGKAKKVILNGGCIVLTGVS
jgi:hypothetical protein